MGKVIVFGGADFKNGQMLDVAKIMMGLTGKGKLHFLLLPFTSGPHFEHPFWHSFEDAVKEGSLSGVGMENGAAFCFVDGRYFTLHGRDGGSCYFYDAAHGFEKTNFHDFPKNAMRCPDPEIGFRRMASIFWWCPLA